MVFSCIIQCVQEYEILIANTNLEMDKDFQCCHTFVDETLVDMWSVNVALSRCYEVGGNIFTKPLKIKAPLTMAKSKVC